MIVTTKDGAQYAKVRNIIELPAAPSLSWEELPDVMDQISSNELISDNFPELDSYIDIFNSVLGVVQPVMQVSAIIEAVKPAVNAAVQIVGAWANPALIPQLLQDGVATLQKIAIDFMVQGVEYAKDFILDIEINLGDLESEDFDEIEDALKDVEGDFNDIADKVVKDFISNGGNNTSKGDLTKLDDGIKNYLDNGIQKAINDISGGTSKEGIVQIVKDSFGDPSIITNTIEVEDKIDSALYEIVKSLEEDIHKELDPIPLYIGTLQKKYANDEKNSLIAESIKNGFLGTMKNIIVGNNKSLLEEYLYKSSEDIDEIARRLKAAIEKRLADEKYLLMQKILRAIEGITDLDLIRSIIRGILEGYYLGYLSEDDLNRILNDILRGFNNYKKNKGYGNKRDEELLNIASGIFNSMEKSLKTLLANLIRDLKECQNIRDLESDQILMANNFVNDVFDELTSYINGLVSFDIDDIYDHICTYINNYPLGPTFNSAYDTGTDSICYKFTSLRGLLHSGTDNALTQIRDSYKNLLYINLPTYITKVPEQEKIMEDIDKMVASFVDTWYEKSLMVFIKNAIPCKNCIDCATLKDKILGELRNNIYSLKLFTKGLLGKVLFSETYIGTLAENKATATALLTQSVKNLILDKQNFYLDYNGIYKKFVCAEQEKLKNVILDMLKK